jgi:hypothetical protein
MLNQLVARQTGRIKSTDLDAVAQNGDPVGDGIDLIDKMRDKQNSNAL